MQHVVHIVAPQLSFEAAISTSHVLLSLLMNVPAVRERVNALAAYTCGSVRAHE